MKKIYTLFVALIFAGCLMAQTPQSFKYQAVARDAGGDVVADQAVGMQISILHGSTSGTAVYVETFTPTTNEFGLINLNIGAGTVISGDLTTINWSADTYFLKIEMDLTGGTTYVEYGTSQLLSVPYALHAKTAANTFSGNYSDLTGTPLNVSTFTNDAGYLTSITETDPVFGSSVASGITGTDTTNWNNKQDLLIAGTGVDITNNVISATCDFFLGQDTLGGIVYYIYIGNGGEQHGLIVSKTEGTANWQNTGVEVGASRSEDGAYNTNLMTNSAAKNWVTALGTGWYLPSIDELSILWHNRFHANKALRAGSYTLLSWGAYYWSSTEINVAEAFSFMFSNGTSTYHDKTAWCAVRAVRVF